MRDLVPSLCLLSVLSVGCGIDVEITEESYHHQIRWTQVPGEIQDCYTFKLDNTRHIEVDRLQVTFPEGSHHVHIYRSSEPEPDNMFDCFKGIDWTRWSLLLGAQTQSMDWQLPDGVTIPLEAHQQLLAQVHWLNTTDAPINEQIDITFNATDYSTEHLGVVFGVNQRIAIAPGQRSRVQTFCQMPDGAKLHALMGHFHVHGNNYKVRQRMPEELGGVQIYSALDEPSFEFKLYNPPHEVPQGAGFEYECNFFNWGGVPLTWGSDTQTQEHCNMTAYFSPAEKISELCLAVPSKLEALTPARDTVRAGQEVTFDIVLAAPQSAPVTLTLQASDATGFDLPEKVTVPAGQQRASFVARARRPGNFEISASIPEARAIATVRVTGLVISELFYKPADDVNANNLQWIELANMADVPLDLSKYSIGAGMSDYMRTNLALPMSIPAKGCIVVGGPVSSAANYYPSFALGADLEPNLEIGGGQAAGVGLFVTAGMSSVARPVDAVVYGGANRSLRGPDGELAPLWPEPAPGGSLKRVAEGAWTTSNLPTPGNCEVLYAQ